MLWRWVCEAWGALWPIVGAELAGPDQTGDVNSGGSGEGGTHRLHHREQGVGTQAPTSCLRPHVQLSGVCGSHWVNLQQWSKVNNKWTGVVESSSWCGRGTHTPSDAGVDRTLCSNIMRSGFNGLHVRAYDPFLVGLV